MIVDFSRKFNEIERKFLNFYGVLKSHLERLKVKLIILKMIQLKTRNGEIKEYYDISVSKIFRDQDYSVKLHY